MVFGRDVYRRNIGRSGMPGLEPILLIDPEAYVIGPCWRLDRKRQLYNNMFGNKYFRPFARRSLISTTESIKHFLESHTSEMSIDTRLRATSYMRVKETQATFEIEGENDRVSEARKWCTLLRRVKDLPLNNEKGTLSVAKSLFPAESIDYNEWRSSEIFIGRTKTKPTGQFEENIYHIGAKAQDLQTLMAGFFSVMNNCLQFSNGDFSDRHPLLRKNHQAFDHISIIALLSLSFTIIHPLCEGNGRIHRLLIHYLLECFKIVDSWLVPVSIIILHDNLKTGNKDRILRAISEPIMRQTKYRFVDRELKITNDTRLLYECWEGTAAVEYMHSLLGKSIRISIDCALYIQIWDQCLKDLDEAREKLTHSQLKMLIGRYLQSGKVSGHTLKQLQKKNIKESTTLAVSRICERVLSDDPCAFKEPFEPFNLHDLQYTEDTDFVPVGLDLPSQPA